MTLYQDTPKASKNNAFCWQSLPEGSPARSTPVDRSAKPRDALRVNRHSDVGRNTTREDSDKTARIRGRTNDARSQ